jgi:hypothetical protein
LLFDEEFPVSRKVTRRRKKSLSLKQDTSIKMKNGQQNEGHAGGYAKNGKLAIAPVVPFPEQWR